MTRAAKIVYGLALVVGLFGGIWFRFSLNAHILRSYYSITRDAAPTVLDDFSFLQYRHADAEHAKVALLAFASLLEKLEASHPDKIQKQRLVNTYARLALVEDRENDLQASSDYLEKARHWYAAGGGSHYPDSEMKNKLKEADQYLEKIGIR